MSKTTSSNTKEPPTVPASCGRGSGGRRGTRPGDKGLDARSHALCPSGQTRSPGAAEEEPWAGTQERTEGFGRRFSQEGDRVRLYQQWGPLPGAEWAPVKAVVDMLRVK